MAKILVVDDEADSLRMIQLMIKLELGYDVITANTGAEALEKSHLADAILTDVVMPVMDGLQLCQALNEREDTRNTPVILMTSYLSPEISAQVKEMNLAYVDFLSKPLNREELCNRLQMLLRIKDAERRLDQASLPDSDKLHILLTACETSSEGITMTDREGKWIFVNQAERKMFGYLMGELMNLKPADLYDEIGAARLKDEVIPNLKKTGNWEGELTGKKASGENFPLHLTLSSVTDQYNKFLGIMSFSTDISETKKFEENLRQRSLDLLGVNRRLQKAYTELMDAQQALVQSERMKTVGEMAGGLAHDIKNLLSGLKGGIDIVDHCLNRNEYNKLADGWQMLKRGHQRVGELVEDLLFCSRRVKPDYKMADISEIIRVEGELFQEQAKRQGIRLKLDTPRGIPKFYFDPKSCRRCLANLLSNALDSLNGVKSPQITISASLDQKAGEITISVADNGRGMSETERAKIFEILYTTKKKGIGLGLVIVKKAVIEHDGRIEVLSRENVGTTFKVTLPLRNKP
ncbi:MAG: ATP-binding protein [PVC group bacterium]